MFGPHLTLDMYGCSKRKLKDVNFVYSFLDEVPELVGMTKIMPPYTFSYSGLKPEDWGVSGIVLIAEKFHGKNIIVNVQEKAQMHMDAIENFMRENSRVIQSYPVQVETSLLDYAKKLSLEEKAKFYEGYVTLIFSDDEEFSLGMRACALPTQRLCGLIRAIYFIAPEKEGCPKIPKRASFEKLEELITASEKRK